MGFTDVPQAPTNKSSANDLAHSVSKHEAGLLLLEGAQPQKKPESKTAATQPAEHPAVKAPAKAIAQAEAPPVKGAPGANPGERVTAGADKHQGIKSADATTDQLREAVKTQDKSFQTRVAHNLDLAKQGTFAIKDILGNFDRIYQDAAKLDMSGVLRDYQSLKPGDKSTAEIHDAENRLLHAPGIIQANKALVAYDAAMKPTLDGSMSRADLIKTAREAMALASQDQAVGKAYKQQAADFEALVAKYKLEAPVGPGAQPRVDAPAAVQPDVAKGQDGPVNGFVPGHKYTDAELANLDKIAQQHAPARQQLEAQLWGDPAKNAQMYLDTKANIFNIVNGMDHYTEQQRTEFQSKLISPNISAADKQKYIDSFAANDKDLHDNATMLLKNTGDKIGVAAKWYGEENYNFQACAAYYQTAQQADVKRDMPAAEKYWNAAQKYALDSTFFTEQLQDPGVARIDAKMTGDYQSLFGLGRQAQEKNDPKNAALLYEDSIYAADRFYEKNQANAKANLDAAAKKLSDGTVLTSDDKLNIGVKAFGSIRVLNAPIEARNNAAAALSGLTQTDDGTYQASKVGQAYQADIARWFKEASTKAADVDVKSTKLVGDALASAAANNVQLHAKGNEKDLAKVAWESAVLVGGKLPDVAGPDGKVIPGKKMPGIIDTPYTTSKMEAAYLITQGKGTDAVNAIKEAGKREATAKGWELKDAAGNDLQLALLMQQAKPLDPNHYLDIMKRSDSLWKTPAQAIGGLALFSLTAYAATKLHNPALLEDAAPALAEKGLLAAGTKNLVKFAPIIAGTTAATAYSYGIDRMSATHDGFLPSAAKGMSLVLVTKGGRYLSRVGANGFAPGVAENMFGAAEKGGGLTAEKILGRMVTETSGKSLAEAKTTVGDLVEAMGKNKAAERTMLSLKSLPAETPVFKAGVLNPAVDKAFLGSSQRELAETLAGALPKAGRIPTIAEAGRALKGTTLDVANADAATLSRELAARELIGRPLAGTARLASERNVLTRLAQEVSGSERNLSKDQLLAYAKSKSVPDKELARIANVIGEDAPILKGGKFQDVFKDAPADLKAQLKQIAADTPGTKGSLTTGQLLEYATKNKLPAEQIAQFERMAANNPLLIKNGAWNPNMLVKNPETGLITRAIDTPNFKGVLGLDNLQNTQLLSSLAKRGATEPNVLIRLAQRANQDVELDAARAMTKRDLVETMTRRGMTPEKIAESYPKLSTLRDTDLLVKGGKFQTSLISRDIPETMTKKEFVAWYKATKNIDLADPVKLAESPWAKSLKSAADDASIIKDGKWQVSISRAARQEVGETSVGLKPKDLGLKEQDGNFLMTATKADLNAGQLANLMERSGMDPAKVEALKKLPADTPLVADGKLVKLPQQNLSPTASTFTTPGNVKEMKDLQLTEGQLSVLAGEATDKQILGTKWYQMGENPWWQAPVRVPLQGGAAMFKSWGKGIVNVVDARGGLPGFTGAIDPLANAPLRRLGAYMGMQNWAYGTLGSAVTYGGFQGINAASTQGYDPVTGERIGFVEDWKNRMGGSMTLKDGIETYGWMGQMPGLFRDLGGPIGKPFQQVFFTAGISEIKDLAESYILGGPAATFKLQGDMEAVKKINDAPLTNHPQILDQANTTDPAMGPVEAPVPAAPVEPAPVVPAPVVPAPAQPQPARKADGPAPARQSSAPPNLRQGAPAVNPGRVVVPAQTEAKKGTANLNDLDSALGGN